VAFTLMVTLLHQKNLRNRHDDFTAALNYFIWFFTMFLVGPILVLAAAGQPIAQTLQMLGLRVGRLGSGLFWCAVGIPISLLIAFLASKDERIQATYPFSKKACTKPGLFVTLEAMYLVFYYVPWEFLFRGLLLFTLVDTVGLWAALSIQTIISTLYHIGHPDTEIIGALLGGFVYGLIAYHTGSIFYTVFLHGLLGIATDTFLYFRHHHKK
jgi:membrane protease YdiL (CAAX protease family)